MALNIDDEWENFMSCGNQEEVNETEFFKNEEGGEFAKSNILNELAPESSPIYISTKTNISYLSMPIDLKTVFWKIPIIPYSRPENGVIKKQMKFNSLAQEELDDISERLKGEECVDENIITSINNPNGRIKFKDIRKVSIGVSKKDLMSYRCKKKSAFYNCFVMIMRIKLNGVFKEFHVKIFNTGKLEIPGIQQEEAFQKILVMVLDTLRPFVDESLNYKTSSTETVLINSNFNCGFYINREALFDILKYKYKIHSIYDPCSYPGIQCKVYYSSDGTVKTGLKNHETPLEETEESKESKKLNEISCMIFRTGSVLIVGKCDESMLYVIYEFLKKLLADEYHQIGKVIPIQDAKSLADKDKKIKTRRKQIMVSA
jgi:hypothetical protein